MLKFSISFLAGFIFLISASSAFAFRPFATEDTDVSEKGEFGIEIGNEYNSDNVNDENVTTLALVYGLTSWLEMEMDFALIYIDPKAESSQFGLGDSVLLGKIKLLGENGLFYDGTESKYIPELIVQPSLLIPTGDEDKGLGSEDFEFGVLVGLQKNISPASVKANIGYFATNDPITDQTFDDRFFYGFEIDFNILNEFIIGTEITGEFETTNNLNPVFSLTGIVYKLNDKLSLDAGFQIGINDTDSSKTIIFGLTWAVHNFS